MGETSPLQRLLVRLDHPMILVTAAADGELGGCLVGFHTQCSVRPLRYAVFLSRRNRTYRLARRTDHLGVHLLSSATRDLAEWFGGRTGDDVDKFADVAHHLGPHGVPLVDRAPHRFVGRVRERVDGGDHLGFVLDPVHVEGADDLVQLGFQDVIDIDPGHDP